MMCSGSNKAAAAVTVWGSDFLGHSFPLLVKPRRGVGQMAARVMPGAHVVKASDGLAVSGGSRISPCRITFGLPPRRLSLACPFSRVRQLQRGPAPLFLSGGWRLLAAAGRCGGATSRCRAGRDAVAKKSGRELGLPPTTSSGGLLELASSLCGCVHACLFRRGHGYVKAAMPSASLAGSGPGVTQCVGFARA